MSNKIPEVGGISRSASSLAAIVVASLAVPSLAQQPADGSVLPYPDYRFEGKLGETPEDSAPQQFVPVRKPREGAPNIFVVLTDDTGFGAASAFGGPISTPALQKLADRGLRYNNFHVAAICSPTRAALLTGRNPHSVGNAMPNEVTTGYPGYVSVLPKSAATMAEILRQNGYSTAMFGKHHNTPRWLATSAGPFDTWPTGLGFDYFYGFLGGDTDQFHPTLKLGNVTVPTPDRPGYTLDQDMADKAIGWIHEQKGSAPDKPFLIYYAPGTLHAPHQAPAEWIARYKGKFDKGWDAIREETIARQKKLGLIPSDTKVSARPHDIAAWSSLSDQEKRVYSRMMEVAAGTLAHQDHQFGRIFDELQRMGELDNTLVIFIEGDNGASAEGGLEGTTNEMGKLGNAVPEGIDYLERIAPELGGPNHYNNYPAGWAWSMDAPFPFYKQVASHRGATTNGMVVSWPKGISARGEVRNQFHYVTDIAPTIYEVTGITMPVSVNGAKQKPLDGTSFAYSFTDRIKPSEHRTQYFEVRGHQAIYHDGWWANTTPKIMPWSAKRRDGLDSGPWKWELYNLREDYAQANDVSAQYPEKLAELRKLWDTEARRNQVYPIQEFAGPDRFLAAINEYGFNRPKSTYWGPLGIPEGAAPSLFSTSFTVTADVDLAAKPEGVLLATGGRFGGWTFYVKDGQVTGMSVLSQRPEHHYAVSAPVTKTGLATIRFDFDSAEGEAFGRGGQLRIIIDGKQSASGPIARTSIVPQNSEEFNIGYDNGTPVSPEYDGRFPFNGTIHKVVVERR